MVDLVYFLKNLIFFDIPSLYYYINLRSSIISYLSFRDIYLSLGISLSCSFVTVSELFCCEFFETLAVLLASLLPVNSPVASAVFLMAFFEVVLSASVAHCLAWSISFWLYLPFKFFLYFYQSFCSYF